MYRILGFKNPYDSLKIQPVHTPSKKTESVCQGNKNSIGLKMYRQKCLRLFGRSHSIGISEKKWPFRYCQIFQHARYRCFSRPSKTILYRRITRNAEYSRLGSMGKTRKRFKNRLESAPSESG